MKIDRVIILEPVIHPDTRQPILEQGYIYSMAQVLRLAQNFGFDNIKVELFIAEN